ncbi:hypothetical protein Tsubulata_030529 [Turnera subulata]|nr:hypothetical protein Tsubulata_030529 [Turnera subulata]
MEEYGFCNGVFHEGLTLPSADFRRLAQLTIERASSNASSTHSFVVQLLAQATEEPLKNVLIACENAYTLVMQSFNKAVVDFYYNDYDSMVRDERAAPKAQASCEVTMKTPPAPPVDPLVDRNREMRILIAMAIVTGHELVPGSP